MNLAGEGDPVTCMADSQGAVEVVVGEVTGVDEVAVGEVEVTDSVATVLVVVVGEVVIGSVMTVLATEEVIVLLTEEVTGLPIEEVTALVVVEDGLPVVIDLVTEEEVIDSLEELVAVQLAARMIGVLAEHQAVAAAVGMMACLTVFWSRDQVAQTGNIYF